MIQISKKGRDFYGQKLSQYDFKGLRLVVYKRNIYMTGIYSLTLVELCNAKGERLHSAKMKKVKLIAS